MSDIIRLLPDSVANQIAAGEVVQRPASVVKELLENAIDAGANQIQLIIKEAGKKLIQVIDNGSGMSETDARMCFERHATSKIKNASDLFAIRTMGFRGEAMASIAAVAQVELKTKQRGADLGTLVYIEASEVKSHEPCQFSEGTSIAVKNLFFNVPARRNFLKTDAIEYKYILEEFQRVALANPKIGFSLFHNGTEIYHLPQDNLRKRVVTLLGANFNERLVAVELEADFIRIYGFVGKPDFARKTRGEQFFFVNERFIKSGYLNHAVMTAYDKLLPDQTYPFYLIFIDIDPARIDVNVHPTKQEIKFDNEQVVYTFVKTTVSRAFGDAQHYPHPRF
jgi:DNA mismatch repair protein MutL